MKSEKIARLNPGTTVITTQPNWDKREGWANETWIKRCFGVQGVIITHHDSHGLCYEIKHPDGTVGCYDPSEFELLFHAHD